VTFDDDLTIAYHTAERLRVALVSGGDAASDHSVEAVFAQGKDSTYALISQAYRNFDLATLQRTDLVILNGLPDVPSGLARALVEFMGGGGSVAMFPPVKPDVAGLSALLAPLRVQGPTSTDTTTTKVDRIDLEEPFYREVFSSMPRNVDLPLVRVRHSFTAPPGADVLLRLQDGSPFLTSVRHGRGRAYVCTSPLSEAGGTFQRHALFPTSLLRMAELSRPMGHLYHILGEEAIIPLEGVAITGESAPHLKGPQGTDLVPELRRLATSTAIVLHDQDLVPGPYALVQGADTLLMLALDLPRTESDLTAYTAAELTTALEQQGLKTFSVLEVAPQELSLSLKELDQGVKLWKWFVLAALVFLALEIVLIRLEK
jgi:hypothetical protein